MASNYGAIGKAWSQEAVAISAANMNASPDYGKIAQEAIKGRSKERVAATEAKSAVHRAGMKGLALAKQYEIKADSDKKIAEIKKPAQRMAGLVSAAGTLASAYVMKQGNDRAKKRHEEYMDELQANRAKIEEAMSRPREKPPATEKPPRMPNIEFEDPSVPGSTPQPLTSGVSSGGPGSTAAPVNVQEMYQYMTVDKGMSHNHAVGLLANIRRESNFVPDIRSGDDGGWGGLFQWKGGRQTPKVQQLVQSGDWRGQIDYALTEPGEPGQRYLQTNFQSEGDAGAYWTRYWERPADIDGGIQFQNNWIRQNSFR